MVVVGGYNSANTCRLAEICSEFNPRTRHIETAAELSPEMLDGVSCVGLTAGASTPEWIIEELVQRIRSIWKEEKIQVSYYQ
jgi:4-hydroxy-3-methylbut-2-enyl diphosphate reductase